MSKKKKTSDLVHTIKDNLKDSHLKQIDSISLLTKENFNENISNFAAESEESFGVINDLLNHLDKFIKQEEQSIYIKYFCETFDLLQHNITSACSCMGYDESTMFNE